MTSVWVHSFCPKPARNSDEVVSCLQNAGLQVAKFESNSGSGPAIIILQHVDAEICEFIRSFCAKDNQRILVIAVAELAHKDVWRLLEAGGSDVLAWKDPGDPGETVKVRLKRWREIDRLVDSSLVRDRLVGQSRVWTSVLRRIVEVGYFTDATVLLTGETGTGKELAAKLIHDLHRKRRKNELVILDCTTIVPELSGSELFGHERGAFTGAISARDGAFTLADGGTLFLDEVGELSLGLQVQLLRVLQEHTYKPVGSNIWRESDFRLLCATNRDLSQEEAEGKFRRDLYYRVASWTIRLPPLRERLDDIIPLVRHFIDQATPKGDPPEMDDRVKAYFLTRRYPGNVRDLKNLVSRIVARHVGAGPITVGDIPADERPDAPGVADWCDNNVSKAVQRALAIGTNLREIRNAIDNVAVNVAMERADGNVQHAAQKLGVSDRTVQKRLVEQRRQASSSLPESCELVSVA